MPCMCGATDCPSCGRAQGYKVKYIPGVGHRNYEVCERCEGHFDPDDLVDCICESCSEDEENEAP